MTETAPDTPDHPLARIRDRLVGHLPWFVAAAAVVVPVHLLVLVLRSSIFSRADYLEMITSVVDVDGSVVWSGLLVHQNDHLVLVPKLVYLVNVWAFSGSNVTLGVFVWTVAAVLFVLLWAAVGRDVPGRWATATTVWLFAIYLFPLHAQHNFRQAMSGTAWIVANLFAVLAIVLLVRGRPAMSGGVGLLATVTYGTGIALWPALAVLMGVRRRFGRGELTLVVLGVVSIAIHRITADASRGSLNDWSPLSIARHAVVTIGGLFTTESSLATLLGTAVIGAAATAVVRLAREPLTVSTQVALAVVVYTSSALALFGISRSLFGPDAFTASRYMAVAGLLVLAASLLVLAAWRWSPTAQVAMLTVAAATVLTGVDRVDRFDRVAHESDIEMVAVRMGVGVGIVPLFSEATEQAFRATGHIPFHGGFDADCGLYGQFVSDEDVTVGEPIPGQVDRRADPSTSSELLRPVEVDVLGAERIGGWIDASLEVDCIVVRDARSQIVGVAIIDGTSAGLVDVGGRPVVVRPWDGFVRSGTTGGEVIVRVHGEERLRVLDDLPDDAD